MFTKEQVEILWTKDYDDFSFYDKNREIDYGHCEKKIQESLVNNGWLKDFPMVVVIDSRGENLYDTSAKEFSEV